MAKKQAHCDPTDPDDDHKGDWWDHVAYDPEHRLDGRVPELMTSDAYPASESAIEATFSEPVDEPVRRGPGRPPSAPPRRRPAGLNYATVHKHREGGRVVAIVTAVLFGTWAGVARALERSGVSRVINTSLLERQHGTDRHRNTRKSRRTYRFSKDWRVHEAMTYFTMSSYNFCWRVRTLRVKDNEGRWQERTPAMSAGLTDHAWSLKEWLTFPAVQRL